MPEPVHPRQALFDAGDLAPALPVRSLRGVESRMRKSLARQAETGRYSTSRSTARTGRPIGGEAEHAHLVAELVASPLNAHGRVGAAAPGAPRCLRRRGRSWYASRRRPPGLP